MPPAKTNPKTIDEYLVGVSADQRAALEKLRKTIQAAAPKAEECISYGLAAFRLNGRPLVAFGAWANHCAFYPMSSNTVEAFQDRLKGFETSKGTIRFSPDKPLPTALVKGLVKARIAEGSGSVSTTGPSATRFVFACSTARRTPSAWLRSGPGEKANQWSASNEASLVLRSW
jgi:uncharacterized protein YdhG (YjbR/CyaY superfamily)